MERLQRERLGSLLRHAHAHVPYYRSVLEACGAVDSSGRVDLKAFTAIPYLDKDIIRGQGDQLHSDDLDRRPWFRNYSGGSTGEPVAFVQEEEEKEQWGRAVTLLFDEWSGRGPGDRWALLWGSERDLCCEPGLRKRYRRHTRRLLALNAFCMTPERMASTWRPSTPSARSTSWPMPAVSTSWTHIRDNHLSVHSPDGIMTSAESIYPEQRELIETVFDAPVFDRYGSREAGNIACECERHSGLHVAAPTHLVELLREDGALAGPGETGEVVVTCYETFAMPLIRYRSATGRRGRRAPAPAVGRGRSWLR